MTSIHIYIYLFSLSFSFSFNFLDVRHLLRKARITDFFCFSLRIKLSFYGFVNLE